MTTGQSTSLGLKAEVKRGILHTAPQAPPYGGGETPALGPAFFTQGKNGRRLRWLGLHACRTFGLLALCLGAAGAQTLKVGVTPGALADSAQIAADEARAAGLEVQIVEFTDWTLPNTALVNGDLDLNYYQHQAFLDTFNRENRQDLRSVGPGVRGNIGLFSRRYTTLASLPQGARVALANDTSNQTRALETLQEAGLIRLRPDAPRLAQLDDIAENPKKLSFIELAGPQLPRALDDADLVVVTPGSLVQAGQNEVAHQGLFYSTGTDTFWGIQFVTRADNANDPRVRQFVSIYQSSAAVRQRVHDSYAGEEKFYSLTWLAASPAQPVAEVK
ncbi:MetQ/NlpA family ABC transporter substrate-binding protein [Kerstersia gyiorum]|uniref:MetQ/NlpA family ABC transporter substrate-binding protein n=1 Tax=Kerstersia gyiorum TaxID=206506 RepID=UPI00209F4D3E|nr:MetQ/NlpA family ABC transporter substrate-binding protein [Kerstersia gyiorum]MCP1633484.1 D-methionine transport system substrate-binding protein [Kerstersia gyiorum]MCP1636355.1 D-methionine transport system substrate-binding protein [Kerstersia gyiorum]MCP1671078.1 D-methionine transport system substrate-binding protein [Kerstersia gyiorum]MCP1679264.1 D-methionine transport system substrate-binding protein [Kerstersia gyiorum]MCP1682067.1 D-methionine transport system substrate-binding